VLCSRGFDSVLPPVETNTITLRAIRWHPSFCVGTPFRPWTQSPKSRDTYGNPGLAWPPRMMCWRHPYRGGHAQSLGNIVICSICVFHIDSRTPNQAGCMLHAAVCLCCGVCVVSPCMCLEHDEIALPLVLELEHSTSNALTLLCKVGPPACSSWHVFVPTGPCRPMLSWVGLVPHPGQCGGASTKTVAAKPETAQPAVCL
jgi:hypothetical protein